MTTKKDPLFDEVFRIFTTEKKHPTLDKILVFLAGSGPCSKWQISKALNLSYGNTYASIKDLLKNELIIILETRASGKNKKIDVEYYGLTLLGFLLALNVVEVKPENKALIVSLIEKQSHLHPSFAKWSTLMQQVPDPALFHALSRAVGSTFYEWNYHQGSFKRLYRDPENYFTEKLLDLVQENYYTSYLSSIDVWFEVIRQNEGLKDYVKANLKDSIRKCHETLEHYEEVLRKLG